MDNPAVASLYRPEQLDPRDESDRARLDELRHAPGGVVELIDNVT